MLLFDAVGLGLFCVTGTAKALSFGVPAVSAVALGVTTAVGGGLLRDVAARDVPSMFRPDDIYALPAVVGATATALFAAADALTEVTAALASAVAVLFRVLALLYGWRIPLAYRELRPDR